MNESGAGPWTLDKVRRCLEDYAELYELTRAGFVGSNWLRKVRSASNVWSYPARFSLLTSQWDLERAVRQLPARARVLFYLRYWADYSQAEISARLGCSQQAVGAALERLPEVLLEVLLAKGGPRVAPRPVMTFREAILGREAREVLVWRAG